jgi:site-specific recombinase XerD
LEAHLDRRRSLNQSSLTVRNARYNLLAFLDWLGRAHQVFEAGQIRQEHADGWLSHVAGQGTTSGVPLKPRSVNKKILFARIFLSELERQGLIGGHVPGRLEMLKEPRMLPGSVLKDDQVRKLIAAVDTTIPSGFRDRVILEILYSTGIRAAELLGLQVADIDLTAGLARVMGKGRKERMVPVGRTAVRLLESYLQAVRPLLLRDPTVQAVFVDDAGLPLPYHTLRRRVHFYASKAGLRVQVTPHTFRRSCTTEMLRAGANMYHVKEMLGHESLDTLKHYALLTIQDLKKTHRRCHPRERRGDGAGEGRTAGTANE